MNKNISVWRGIDPPPTNTHVWITKLNDILLHDGFKWRKKLDGGDGSTISELMQEVTHSELIALRNNAILVAGTKYRITDYVTTTVQQDTKSANHPFDIIVEAVSENELSELAQAIQHEGDNYFDGNNLGAWQLWYDLDNNTNKYEWADVKNGKGVIFRMIDEKRNDCPYDFKNVLFYNNKYTSSTTSDKYYYTFSYVVNDMLYDGTVNENVTMCRNNSMKVYKIDSRFQLNKNIWLNKTFNHQCHSNTFGDLCYSNMFYLDCHSNTFGYLCHSNTFGNHCHSNTFNAKCYSNTFDSNCDFNTFGSSCLYNKFGNNCLYNTFGSSCLYNTFGGSCYSNTFDSNCDFNTFIQACHSNKFGNNCYYNTFGNFCSSNKFDGYCYYNTFGDFCSSNMFGESCYYKTFDAYFSGRQLNSDKTTIILNDEYYDDGTDALVPIKHPDLSTQPSILPYKFMGQYVYEQLIVNKGESYISISISNTLAVKNPLIISIDAIGTLYTNALLYNINDDVLTIDLGDSSMRRSTPFVKIVYTSMPEEGGYYGYNNY